MQQDASGGPRAALCIALFTWRPDGDGSKPGVPARDLLWWSGFVVTAAQLGVSVIPLALYEDWSVLLATAAGTLLCYASASIPQWRHEKWHARTTNKDVALTLGNGTQHVVIIRGADHGLDLEDLAGGRAPDLWSTRIWTSVLAIFWLVHLVTCTAIQANTWYLLAVGGLGMVHNLVVAGVPRSPAAMGLPIEPVRGSGEPASPTALGVEIFAERKVMWTLMELETKHKGYGRALVDEFFPGQLRGWEVTWWDKETKAEERTRLLWLAREGGTEKNVVPVG